MHSSKLFAGLQWNIPVESYFISVFSKSKSLDWSSAIPACSVTPFWFCAPDPPPRLVGLQGVRTKYFSSIPQRIAMQVVVKHAQLKGTTKFNGILRVAYQVWLQTQNPKNTFIEQRKLRGVGNSWPISYWKWGERGGNQTFGVHQSGIIWRWWI